VKWLFALLALVMLTGARDPILVADVSPSQVQLRQGFNGTELMLFGAILTPEGTRAGQDYDIVVVLEGPVSPVVLREKQKIAGIWVNAQSTTLRSLPSFYAVASSRPIRDIVDERTAAIYEIGLDALQLSPTDSIDGAAKEHFNKGLVNLMRSKGLFRQDEHAVSLKSQVLYQARIPMPSSVQPGSYTAETFAIQRGRVVASAITRVDVSKQGMERAIYNYSRHQAFAYGLLVISLSVLMGWAAGRLFALI
jgi:uncharacterized protein (TIGR02186 family)